MLAPADAGWDIAVYARTWLDERAKVALETARRVASSPSRSAVHDVRVACRRLREAIAFFQGLAGLPPLAHVDRAAQRMARSVRRVRETDVACKRLAELEIHVGGAQSASIKERLASALRQRRTKLLQDKHDRIGKRARQLRAAFRTALPRNARAMPQVHDAGQEAIFQAFVEARVAQRRAEVERLFASARASKSVAALVRATDELHAVRVAVKHWRYASEIARPAIPRALYRPMAAELRQLQDLGGASQDFADLAEVLREQLEHAGKPSAEEKQVLDAVRSARDRASRAFADALAATFPRSRPLPLPSPS